jgi:hypothetical protein
VADLLSTPAGINTLNRIACFLGRKWSSRNMERAFWRAFKQWETTGYFDRSVMLHELNPIVQDDIESLDNFLASIGCLDTIESNTTIYVDPVAGSDLTGDGSLDHPYATLGFLECYTKKINANFRVLLLNDLDMGIDPLNLDFEICAGGCFSICGVGAPTVVTTSLGAGPFTITDVQHYGGAPTNDYGHDIKIAGTTVAYELVGKWIRFLTGPNAGEVYPVNTNSGSWIFIRGGLEADPVIGNTFDIVEPKITLSCQTVNIEMSGLDNVLTFTEQASRFNMLNLRLDLTGSLPAYNATRNFVLNNQLESQMSFVTLSSENHNEPIHIESNLNRYSATDSDIALYLNTGIQNIDGPASSGTQSGVIFYDANITGYTYTFAVIRGAYFVRCVECYNVIEVRSSLLDLQICGLGSVRGDFGSSCQVSRCAISVGGDNCFKLLYVGPWKMLRIVSSDVGGPTNFLWILSGKVHMLFNTLDIHSGFGLSGHAVYYNMGNAQVFSNTDPTTLGGGLWFPGGVGNTAMPAADAIATDNLGNTFSYISTP